jgi:6-phospho-3-hexuloisomerase
MTMAAFEQILGELRDVLSRTDPREEDAFIRQLLASKRVFVCGLGRSGLMMRAFAMRLMHLGLSSYVVGETTTPSIQEGDLLVVGSGSGETSTPVGMARLAKKAGATLVAITGRRESSLAHLADAVVLIPSRSVNVTGTASRPSCQPLGTLAEQSMLLYLDSVVVRLWSMIGETSDALSRRHANLE